MGDLQKNPVDTQFIQPNNMEKTTPLSVSFHSVLKANFE